MTKNRIVFVIGIILFLMPLLGFTTYQKNFFLIVCGGVLIALSFSTSINKRKTIPKVRKSRKDVASSVFVDGHGSFSAESEIKNSPVVKESSPEASELAESESGNHE